MRAAAVLLLASAAAFAAQDEPLDRAVGLDRPVLRHELVGFLEGGGRLVLRRGGRLEVYDRATRRTEILPLPRWGILSPDGLRLFDVDDGSVVNIDGTGRVRPAPESDPIHLRWAWTSPTSALLFKGRVYAESDPWPERLRCVMQELRLSGRTNGLRVLRERPLAFNPLENAVEVSPTARHAAVQFGQVTPYWIKVFDLRTGAERTVLQVDDVTRARPTLHFWTPDGAAFLFSWNGLWLASTNGERRLVTREPCEPVGFAPHGKTLLVKKLFVKGVTLVASDLFLIDLEGREVAKATDHPKLFEGRVLWPNPAEVFYTDTTDYRKEHFRLLRLPPPAGR